jgi:hypothetical protein
MQCRAIKQKSRFATHQTEVHIKNKYVEKLGKSVGKRMNHPENLETTTCTNDIIFQ